MKEAILATRGSRLARAQAEEVRQALMNLGWRVKLCIVSTRGDLDRRGALREIGGNGLFVREIERVLHTGAADLAVHSAKDLPYQLMKGLVIAGTPKAEDPRDCLLYPAGKPPRPGSRIGTGSPRRRLEFEKSYPRVNYLEIRGNVTTRVDKLRRGEYDGIILAKAGLDRLGWSAEDIAVRVFEPEEMLPAPCQGILAVECRAEDTALRAALSEISDAETHRRFLAEREMFGALQTDCSVPAAAYAEVMGDRVRLRAMLQGRQAEVTGLFETYPVLCAKLRKCLNEE
jgi:hydroxymethylbilane synthase